jgi:hypothetical protein
MVRSAHAVIASLLVCASGMGADVAAERRVEETLRAYEQAWSRHDAHEVALRRAPRLLDRGLRWPPAGTLP